MDLKSRASRTGRRPQSMRQQLLKKVPPPGHAPSTIPGAAHVPRTQLEGAAGQRIGAPPATHGARPAVSHKMRTAGAPIQDVAAPCTQLHATGAAKLQNTGTILLFACALLFTRNNVPTNANVAAARKSFLSSRIWKPLEKNCADLCRLTMPNANRTCRRQQSIAGAKASEKPLSRLLSRPPPPRSIG
jgi:hypothetical protein